MRVYVFPTQHQCLFAAPLGLRVPLAAAKTVSRPYSLEVQRLSDTPSGTSLHRRPKCNSGLADMNTVTIRSGKDNGVPRPAHYVKYVLHRQVPVLMGLGSWLTPEGQLGRIRRPECLENI